MLECLDWMSGCISML